LVRAGSDRVDGERLDLLPPVEQRRGATLCGSAGVTAFGLDSLAQFGAEEGPAGPEAEAGDRGAFGQMQPVVGLTDLLAVVPEHLDSMGPCLPAGDGERQGLRDERKLPRLGEEPGLTVGLGEERRREHGSPDGGEPARRVAHHSTSSSKWMSVAAGRQRRSR
jgi:hypothetical protein